MSRGGAWQLFALLSMPLTAVAAEVDAEWPCGVTCVAIMARYAGVALAPSDVQRLATAAQSPSHSLLEVKELADSVGVQLRGVKGTLDEMAALGEPLILGLERPDHFALLIALSSTHVAVAEGRNGLVTLYPREGIEDRCTGIALRIARRGPTAPALRVASGLEELGPALVGGEAVTGAFQLQNTGQGELVVSVQSMSCPCSTAHSQPLILGTGEQKELSFQVRPTDPGPNVVVIYVRANDPDLPFRPLVALVEASLGVTIRPSRPSLQLLAGRAGEQMITVMGPPHLVITAVHSDQDWLTGSLIGRGVEDAANAQLAPTEGEGSWHRIRLQVAPTLSPGRYKAVIHVDLAGLERKSVELETVVRQPYELTPSVVILSPARRQQAVQIRSLDGRPVPKLEEVVSDVNWLTAKRQQIEAASTIDIMTDGPNQEYLATTLQLKLSDGSTMSLPVVWMPEGG